MSEYKIEFCRGSNGEQAIYVGDKGVATRIFGIKCCGFVKTIASFPLNDVSRIDSAIKELEYVKSQIEKEKK
jgi:hypothetical protein